MTDERTPITPGQTPLEQYLGDFGRDYVAATAAAADGAAAMVPGAAADAGDAVSRDAARSRGRRRVPRPALGIGGVLVGAAVLIAVLLSLGGRVDLVEEARAALGSPGEIVHFTVYSRPLHRTARDGLCTPADPADSPHTEVWQTTSAPLRFRTVSPAMDPKCGVMSTVDGTQISGPSAYALDGTTSTTYYPDLDRLDRITDLPANAPSAAAAAIGFPNGGGRGQDFVGDLRSLLTDEHFHVVGHGTEPDGRRVVTLAGQMITARGHGAGYSKSIRDMTYVLDAETYVPVRFTQHSKFTFRRGNGRVRDGVMTVPATVTTFPIYERLPLNDKTAKLLTIQPQRPTHGYTKTAAALKVESDRIMRRQNAEGRRNAARAHARLARERAAAKKATAAKP
jgi:hypothetical protein